MQKKHKTHEYYEQLDLSKVRKTARPLVKRDTEKVYTGSVDVEPANRIFATVEDRIAYEDAWLAQKRRASVALTSE